MVINIANLMVINITTDSFKLTSTNINGNKGILTDYLLAKRITTYSRPGLPIDKNYIEFEYDDININANQKLNLNSDTTISGNLNITGGDLTCSTANLSVVNSQSVHSQSIWCSAFTWRDKAYSFPTTDTTISLQAKIPDNTYTFTVSSTAMNSLMTYSVTNKIWELNINMSSNIGKNYCLAWLYGWNSSNNNMFDFGPIYLFKPRTSGVTAYRRYGRVIANGTYLYYAEMFVTLSNDLTNYISIGVFKKTLSATSWTQCSSTDMSLYLARSTKISV